MSFKETFQRMSKNRFMIMYPFGLYLILFTCSDDHSILRGIGFIVAGLLTRLWANCYAIKMDKLTTSGPYAFVRHPLYLGSLLIVLGFIIMLKIYVVGGLFLILYLMIYWRTLRTEEEMLIAKFKDGYLNYRAAVPAVIPRLTPYKEGDKWSFSFYRLLQSQEYKIVIWMIVLVIAFHLKDELWIERETMDLRIWIFIITAFLLACCDPILDMIRKKAKLKMTAS